MCGNRIWKMKNGHEAIFRTKTESFRSVSRRDRHIFSPWTPDRRYKGTTPPCRKNVHCTSASMTSSHRIPGNNRSRIEYDVEFEFQISNGELRKVWPILRENYGKYQDWNVEFKNIFPFHFYFDRESHAWTVSKYESHVNTWNRKNSKG